MADDGPQLSLRHVGENITVEVGAGQITTPVDIYFVTYDDEQATDVTRGENLGKKLVNARVVREMRRIGRWDGTERRKNMSSCFEVRVAMRAAPCCYNRQVGPYRVHSL
jgi:hypothetical protein